MPITRQKWMRYIGPTLVGMLVGIISFIGLQIANQDDVNLDCVASILLEDVESRSDVDSERLEQVCPGVEPLILTPQEPQ